METDRETAKLMNVVRRIARAATSAREFHSGEPGEASGRQRLQARKPVALAAANVAWKATFFGFAPLEGHDGRQ